MLRVATFEFGDPVAIFIEMKAGDAPWSHEKNRLRFFVSVRLELRLG